MMPSLLISIWMRDYFSHKTFHHPSLFTDSALVLSEGYFRNFGRKSNLENTKAQHPFEGVTLLDEKTICLFV